MTTTIVSAVDSGISQMLSARCGDGLDEARVDTVGQPVPPARVGRINGAGPYGWSRRVTAWLDAPNITSALYHRMGDAYYCVYAIGLTVLREYLVLRYGNGPYYYVVARNGRSRSLRAAWVRAAGWQFVEASEPSMMNRDPVDCFIIGGIQAARSQLASHGPRTLIIISNDGGYAAPLEAYLRAGGYVVICGFLRSMSLKLQALSVHPRCDLLDLDYDLKAVISVVDFGGRPPHSRWRPRAATGT